MGKNTIEVATKPLKGAQKSVDRANFSVRNGIHKLVKELGGDDMQIGSKAMKVVNDLARDLIVKFAETCNEGALERTATTVKVQKVSKKTGRPYMATKQVMRGNTMSLHDLKTAAALIIKDEQLRTLNDQNAINCCKYTYTTRSKVPPEMLVYGKGSKNDMIKSPVAKNDMIKFPVAYIKRFVKTLDGKSYRIGVGAKALTTRVQHIVGELIGMACTTASDLGDKRINTRHLQLVLSFDHALEDVFVMPGSIMKPAAAIGAGMPDLSKTDLEEKRSKRKKAVKAKYGDFENPAVRANLMVAANPYM